MNSSAAEKVRLTGQDVDRLVDEARPRHVVGAVRLHRLALGPDVPVDQVRLLGEQVAAEQADHRRRAAAVLAHIEDHGVGVGQEVHGRHGRSEGLVAVGEAVEA